MKLYTYWRSTAAYRVRIALNLKGVARQDVFVSLVAGEQGAPDYAALNPQKLVPALELDDGTVLTQSLAIIDWLEATQPTPALLPSEAVARARVLAAAHVVACDIHPVNNLRVLQALSAHFNADEGARIAWMHHWMQLGFDTLEATLPAPRFAFGTAPGLADICLIPQLYNARRWGLDLTPWPNLTKIEAACLDLPAFAEAVPEAQPDATG
ncbi:MAG: maleylacetoacetate isomerase [Pararhodobacter sp.]|nr:maleylacetoacetate isomerase [Pararhodobacter sp.]